MEGHAAEEFQVPRHGTCQLVWVLQVNSTQRKTSPCFTVISHHYRRWELRFRRSRFDFRFGPKRKAVNESGSRETIQMVFKNRLGAWETGGKSTCRPLIIEAFIMHLSIACACLSRKPQKTANARRPHVLHPRKRT